MKKVFVMTALVAGATVSSFGAVSGGYCHSAEYYRQQKKPVASTSSGLSERERIAAMDLEAARLKLETAKISAGIGVDESLAKDKKETLAKSITEGESVKEVRRKAAAGNSKYQLMMARLYEEVGSQHKNAAACYAEVCGNASATLTEKETSKKAVLALIKGKFITLSMISLEDRRFLGL